MIREIVTYPNPRLREASSVVRRISPKVLKELIRDMQDTVKAYNGVGLAAPQIGVNKRIIFVKDKELSVILLNPKIIELTDEKYLSKEGCLSVPCDPFTVKRCARIRVEGNVPIEVEDNIVFSKYSAEFEHFLAAVFQHEVDHLDGKLMLDRLSPVAKDMYIRKITKNIKKRQAWRYQVATSL